MDGNGGYAKDGDGLLVLLLRLRGVAMGWGLLVVILRVAVLQVVLRRGEVSVLDVVGIAVLMWDGAMGCLHDTVLRRIAQRWLRY